MQTGYVSITPLRLDTDLSFSETQIPSKWDISHLLCTFHLPRVYKIKFKIEVRQSVQCGCCECQKLSSDWLSTSGHPKNPASEKISIQPEKKIDAFNNTHAVAILHYSYFDSDKQLQERVFRHLKFLHKIQWVEITMGFLCLLKLPKGSNNESIERSIFKRKSSNFFLLIDQ